MQSLIQHRKLGAAARAQLDRDAEKANGEPFVPGQTALRTEPMVVPNDGDVERQSGQDDNDDDDDDESNRLQAVLTGVQERSDPSRDNEKVLVVGWAGPDDPLAPTNWSTRKRAGVTMQISLLGILLTAASGTDATVIPQAAKDLGVSEVAQSLATGLYLVGMGLGSLIAGPFSETFGRNAVYMVSLVIYMIWMMACGLAPNFGALIVFRLLVGCSASAPLVCAGGSIADMFNSREKTWAFPQYAICSFTGPMLGAIIGAYIGPSHVTWRWVEWSMLIGSGLVLAVVCTLMPETYSPLLLQWKAAHYRRLTGDDRFRCEHEIADATLASRLKISMTRPFLMITEPIIMAMTCYITVIYVVLFTFLIGWPYIFEYTYGIGQGLSNLVFASMLVGTELTFIAVPIVYNRTVRRMAADEKSGSSWTPEIRLWYGTHGGAAIAIPVSLFWLGWTDYASISIWSPIIAVALFGYGVMGIFLCVYMYIIDSYEIYSASALTFVALTRYVVAGGMTVVGLPFYRNMGVHYTLTILGSISILLVPIPYLLYFYGHTLRAKSKFAFA